MVRPPSVGGVEELPSPPKAIGVTFKKKKNLYTNGILLLLCIIKDDISRHKDQGAIHATDILG